MDRDLAEQYALDILDTCETAEHAHLLLECQLRMLSVQCVDDTAHFVAAAACLKL